MAHIALSTLNKLSEFCLENQVIDTIRALRFETKSKPGKFEYDSDCIYIDINHRDYSGLSSLNEVVLSISRKCIEAKQRVQYDQIEHYYE